jgi:hypothetical protein
MGSTVYQQTSLSQQQNDVIRLWFVAAFFSCYCGCFVRKNEVEMRLRFSFTRQLVYSKIKKHENKDFIFKYAVADECRNGFCRNNLVA